LDIVQYMRKEAHYHTQPKGHWVYLPVSAVSTKPALAAAPLANGQLDGTKSLANAPSNAL